jgi:hypothetical protein
MHIMCDLWDPYYISYSLQNVINSIMLRATSSIALHIFTNRHGNIDNCLQQSTKINY